MPNTSFGVELKELAKVMLVLPVLVPPLVITETMAELGKVYRFYSSSYLTTGPGSTRRVSLMREVTQSIDGKLPFE
jgi:hypothetical protein